MALLLSCFWLQGADKITCDTCPVTGIDPEGSESLASPTKTTGCTTTTKKGLLLPDPECTPGAINPTVTLAVLKNPAFRTGCVRDCTTSGATKIKTYAAYGIEKPALNTGSAQTCELDHLVSLELGGADSLDNIWPQCGPDKTTLMNRFFKRKDTVENYLAARVRAGQKTLAEVQKGIAADWTQYLAEAVTFCKNNPNTCAAQSR